ncbi:GHMP family kinase ATP-binding protein [Sorangium sp. So ce381]|uniref:GHMP family kinase ATP-binding protein n=1 Tax=Sorangium sp. So ce381 TaxID=3133307 RepID=UPI003F5BBE49
MSVVPTPIAFSPGSVTCFFLPCRQSSPAETASKGCAINISQGVTAGLRTGGSMATFLNGRPIDLPTVRQVLDELAPEPVHVFLETPLPIGCGFGVSAAAALSTAFALTRRFGLQRSREEVALVAHVAEVSNHTGIGDVAAQLCGGVVYRRCLSDPFDALQIPIQVPQLYYRAYGPLSTAAILASPDRYAAVVSEGERAIIWLTRNFDSLTICNIFDRSVEFTERTGLLTDPRVIDALAEARANNANAMMILLGHSVLSTQPGREDPAWTPCMVDREGTRYLQ